LRLANCIVLAASRRFAGVGEDRQILPPLKKGDGAEKNFVFLPASPKRRDSTFYKNVIK